MKKIILIFIYLISFYSTSQVTDSMDISRINKKLESKIEKILKTPESASKYLTVRVFSSELFDDTIKKNLIYRNDFEGLISVLTLNLDEAVKSINRNEIKHWNLNDEKLFSLAKEQTNKNVESISFDILDVDDTMKYYVAYEEQNYFVNSLLFFPDLLKKFDINGRGIIIGIPVRHICTEMEKEVYPPPPEEEKK